MAQVKGSVARVPSGQGTHKNAPWGKELAFDIGHTPEGTHSRFTRLFLLPYVMPPSIPLLEQDRAIKDRNTPLPMVGFPAYSILGGGGMGERKGGGRKLERK